MDFRKLYRLDAAICLVVAALAAWAVARHPYGYYTFVRWLVCLAGIYMAWRLYESKLAPFAVVFGITAILFNPIAPIHLSRSTWQPLDIACAIIFLGGAFLAARLKPIRMK